MKIELGKKYVTYGGEIVGPMEEYKTFSMEENYFEASVEGTPIKRLYVIDTGCRIAREPHHSDNIERQYKEQFLIKEGKYYRQRNGNIVGPIKICGRHENLCGAPGYSSSMWYVGHQDSLVASPRPGKSTNYDMPTDLIEEIDLVPAPEVARLYRLLDEAVVNAINGGAYDWGRDNHPEIFKREAINRIQILEQKLAEVGG